MKSILESCGYDIWQGDDELHLHLLPFELHFKLHFQSLHLLHSVCYRRDRSCWIIYCNCENHFIPGVPEYKVLPMFVIRFEYKLFSLSTQWTMSNRSATKLGISHFMITSFPRITCAWLTYVLYSCVTTVHGISRNQFDRYLYRFSIFRFKYIWN